jgi:hypothetical protein
MAITNHRIVTGVAGGESGILNVGTGADVTWPTTGNPSLAATGLYYTTAEGTGGVINLTTASDRGTHYAWGAQGDGDSKPDWATGPGYIELPAAATNQRVMFLNETDLNAITSGQWTDGFDVTIGIQFAVSGTYNPGTVPQNNNTAISIMQPATDSATHAQVRVQSRNVEGFQPGVEFTFGAYTGTYTITGGSSSSDPMVHIPYNQWVQLRVHWMRATDATSNNGTIRVWLGDQMICHHTGADAWFVAAVNMGRLAGLLSGYSTAITGCKIRYCPPIKVRVVPEADLVPEGSWSENTRQGRDLRRFYSCLVAGPGSHWSFSGTATTPTTGTNYSVSGVNPLRRRFVIPGTASQTFLMEYNGFVWTGDAADSPVGPDGRVWYRFTDLYTANNCDFDITIDGNASPTALHTISLNASTDDLVVDGVQLASSLATSRRYELLVGIGTANTAVILNDVTETSKNATMLGSWVVTTFSGTGRWDGTQLGSFSVSGTYAGSVSAEVGPVGIYAKLRVVECDSFVSAAANGASPVLATTANHMGIYLVNAEDRIVAGGYDPIPQTGGKSGMAVALLLGRSGGRLSESETHFWPEMTGYQIHGLLVSGVINDVSAASDTFDEADDNAEAIANRIVDWCDWCVDSGGTATVFEGINAASGSATGSYTNLAMSVPGVVWSKLPNKLRAQGYASGKVFHAPAFGYIIGNPTSADGIHPLAAASRNAMLSNHRALQDAKGSPGNNADGSVGFTSSGGSRSDRHG